MSNKQEGIYYINVVKTAVIIITTLNQNEIK